MTKALMDSSWDSAPLVTLAPQMGQVAACSWARGKRSVDFRQRRVSHSEKLSFQGARTRRRVACKLLNCRAGPYSGDSAVTDSPLMLNIRVAV